MSHYNQYLVKTCWRRSFHDCLSWAECVQSLTPRVRLSLFTPSTDLDFGLPWFLLPLGLTLNRAVCGRSSGLLVFWSWDQHSAICLSSWHSRHSGCQTLYRVHGCTFSCRHHFRFSGRISFGEPFSQIRAIGSPPFRSTPTSHCRRAGLGGSRSCECWILSGVKGGSTADVCAVRRSTYLQSGFFGVFPDSRHSLVSSGILGTQFLWHLQSVGRQLPRLWIVLWFRAAIIYFVFCSFIFNLNLDASISNAKLAPRTADWLLPTISIYYAVDCVCRYALCVYYNRRTIITSTILKNRLDNTSPWCLNPCLVSKDSEP
jgi:hypothetical protein